LGQFPFLNIFDFASRYFLEIWVLGIVPIPNQWEKNCPNSFSLSFYETGAKGNWNNSRQLRAKFNNNSNWKDESCAVYFLY
jgi:hypothetical protein